MKIVISQSMYFPWVGMLEQIRLADIFVHYDDVPFTKGGFINRVQIKTNHGSRWLTVPTKVFRHGQRIDEVKVDNKNNWKKKHRESLIQAYSKAPYRDEMIDLVDLVFAGEHETIASVSRASLLTLCSYFAIDRECRFYDASSLGVEGRSSERVLGIVKKMAGTIYITGKGAANYLDHKIFEQDRIRVEYMRYKMMAYPQLHGEYIPFVSSLDLVANCGRGGINVICSGTEYWKELNL